VHDALDFLDACGLLDWPEDGGAPEFVRYLENVEGALVDVITDIRPLSAFSAEKLGYPTQKPLALLEMLVKASSNPGDLVLDPFCGCGTTIEAAEMLGRAWAGIGATYLAIELTERRLREGYRRKNLSWETIGAPGDVDDAKALAARDLSQFKAWARSLLAARHPENLRKGVRGINGEIPFNDEGPKAEAKRVLISVKGAARLDPSALRALRGAVDLEGAAAGILVSLAEPSSKMRAEAAAAGAYLPPERTAKRADPVPRLQILAARELLEGKRPVLPPDFSGGRAAFKRDFKAADGNSPGKLF
jgi:site-specific DNA-methyltransferase (adenine-specific)